MKFTLTSESELPSQKSKKIIKCVSDFPKNLALFDNQTNDVL